MCTQVYISRSANKVQDMGQEPTPLLSCPPGSRTPEQQAVEASALPRPWVSQALRQGPQQVSSAAQGSGRPAGG